jgi:anti-sigma factor RsiW
MSGQRDCRTIKRRLSAYQDGELGPTDRERVREHLEACLACRGRYEELERVWQILGEWSEVQPTPEFHPGLMRKIGGRPKAGPLQRLRWALQPFPAALPAPAVLIVGILVGVYAGHLLVTGNANPVRSRPGSSLAAAATLASLRAFDPIPPGTVGEGYLRATCDLKDGHR